MVKRITPIIEMRKNLPNNLFLALAHTEAKYMVGEKCTAYYPLQEQIICALKYNNRWWE